MIELAFFIAFIVIMIGARKLVRMWLQQQAEAVELWVEDAKNERQHEIKRVYDERKGIISRNSDKWYTVDDIQDLSN